MFAEFMADEFAWDMYVTGAAGTGKTHGMAVEVQYCTDNSIPYIVCAYTHKACDVLRHKLPGGANIATLHSFLKKRPSINTNAKHKSHIDTVNNSGAPDDTPVVMFLDEYSFVGESDGMSIVEAQDSDYDGKPSLKVVWYGDKHQLPPVGDSQYVRPNGKYQKVLTKQYRNDNPLQKPLVSLISYLDGAQPAPLSPVNGYFIRDKDIVTEFLRSPEKDKIALAYTNKRVQDLNKRIEGKDKPSCGDKVYSPTANRTFVFSGYTSEPDEIQCHYSNSLELGSKYRTLEHLIAMGTDFAELDGEVWAVVFGHHNFKIKSKALADTAIAANNNIPSSNAAQWSKMHTHDARARARAKAWRDYLCFKDYVICIDFTHATTVHKSQGSTFREVYLATDDLYFADTHMYLRLMYVGISRAARKVITE